MSEKTAEISVTSGSKPIRVCLLGSEGSGKTCFLAGLAVLREPNRHKRITVRGKDRATVEFLDEMQGTLRRQQWPPPTNMTTILNMSIGLGKTAIEVLIVDYPGEDFRNELMKLKRDRIKELHDHYADSEAILLLFDPDRDVRAVGDLAHSDELIKRQMAHLEAIDELWATNSAQLACGRTKQVDVAIIVTKSDKESDLSDSSSVKRFFQKHAGRLDAKIRRRAHVVEYFPLSAIGHSVSDARDGKAPILPGKELSPSGYEEILGWVLRRHQWRVWQPWFRRGIIAAILTCIVGLALFGWQSLQQSDGLAILKDPKLSRVEKLERTQECSDTAVRQLRATVFSEEMATLSTNLDLATGSPAVEEVLGKADRLANMQPGAMLTQIDSLRQACRQKEEDILHQKLGDAYSSNALDFPDLAGRFLRDYPASPRCDKVRDLINKRRGEDEKRDRDRIDHIRVISADNLAQKGEDISKFVAKYQASLTGDEVKRMRRAAELARQFSEKNTYKVKLKQTSGLTDAYFQGVNLRIEGTMVKEYATSGKSREVNWDDDDIKIQWSAGQPILVTWRKLWSAGSWGNSDIATLHDDGPVALRILSGKQPLRVESDWVKLCPNSLIHFEVDGISEDDWKLFALYVFPGGGL